jgi:PTH2 family peptidyl-tRNA hydrolase
MKPEEGWRALENDKVMETPGCSRTRKVWHASLFRGSGAVDWFSFVRIRTDSENSKLSVNQVRSLLAAKSVPLRFWKFGKDISDRLLHQGERENHSKAADNVAPQDFMRMDAPKLVVVCRNDIRMSTGKVAAQVAHATLAAYRNHCLNHAENTQQSAICERWLAEGEKIIVLSTFKRPPQRSMSATAGSKPEQNSGARMLEALIKEARALGLPLAQVRDAGRTELKPHTLTCIAIGPAASGRIDAVTGDLRLYDLERRQSEDKSRSPRYRRSYRRGVGR